MDRSTSHSSHDGGNDLNSTFTCSSASLAESRSSDSLSQIIERELEYPSLSRRSFVRLLTGSACATAWVLHSGSQSVATAATSQATAGGSDKLSFELFGFEGVPTSLADEVIVPDGYVAEVLYRWGDPIDGVSPQFLPDASNSAADQERQAGMGHDGMEFFALPGTDPNREGLLAINHEYTDQVLLFADGLGADPHQAMTAEKVRKSIASHGVSIVQIRRNDDGVWSIVPSSLARRITADTPARISGPATAKLGDSVRGTVNNCASGRTPWGTYLTCEENFQSVFGTNASNFQPDDAQRAYGLDSTGYCYKIGGKKVPAYRWWDHHPRFDLAHSDSDAERFGYVVEIDPLRPESMPVKRTALGRFRHENAELTVAPNGQIVVYMGDDEVNQFVYKFVSRDSWDTKTTRQNTDPLNLKLLDEGTLYVARFDADGSGQWLELTPGKNGIPIKSGSDSASSSNGGNGSLNNGFDAADICIRTRMAAKIAGATPMDRAEWIAVHPETGEVFVSLTNNRSRAEPNAANPRSKNIFGHIVRFRAKNGDPTDTRFDWNVFVLAGNPAHQEPANQGNAQGDFFACPDGLKFDSSGILWIQTDMSSSVMGTAGYEELGNNMMLAANPTTSEVRRFLTGPRGCEITGMAMTPDRKTMFVNIQHPGEPSDELSDPNAPQKYSSWPDGQAGGRPRSATIAIRKKDGGVIGS